VKDKEKLSMYVDITRITITLCWVALIAFWCLKLFGGNWFEIMVENENFIKFSELVQNTWLKYLVSLFTIGIAKYFTYGAISQKFVFKGKSLVLVLVGIISTWAIANFIPFEFASFSSWFGYIFYILFAVIYQKGWKRIYGILAIIFEFAFSTISLLVRNIPLYVLDNYLMILVLIIDVNIMIILYYLYSNLIKLEEENSMLLLGTGWLSKESAQQNGYNAWKRFWHNVGYALSFKWAKKK
jgi:hypothetical protein